MISTGISITRDRILAVVVEGSASSLRIAGEASVPCAEPFGTGVDAASLARELQNILPGTSLPGAVLTLPPSVTYIRKLALPVSDLPRARAIHLAELEGNLPIEDDEILSDLLPAAPGSPGTFFAVAAKRSFVESTVEKFRSAGILVDRVVTDHVALAALAADRSGPPGGGVYLSAFSDILLLRVSGDGISAARQFPKALLDSPEVIAEAVRETPGDGGSSSAGTPFLVGEIPAALAERVPGAVALPPPEGVSPSHAAACGAALAAIRPDVCGGFSLRTSAEAASESVRSRRRSVVAAVAGGAALLLALGSFEFTLWAEGEKAARAREAVRKEFTAAAPDVRNVVQAGLQLRSKLDALRRQRKELGIDAPPAADLLFLASGSLPKGEIALREVSIEGARLRLAGEAAGGARLVEAYRAGLSEAFGPSFTVTVQESEGSVRGTTVRFSILVDRKGERGAS
jgi:hypothetical protein